MGSEDVLSIYDASPKALNEAMSFPIPMIVSDSVGTSRDLVHHGINGYIFSDGDEESLVGYFNHFAEEPDVRIGMGKENAGIISKYTLEVAMKNLVEAIREND